ncbi:MAG: bifunctional 5,10-methylenetetrahydrofolate dehydrogenase/5,10-methenyltetrahydrofolate cyclohydrolase, partial [Zavarzinella sp.]|nr:bifunctional 5,10-methylenetetrahydrofolate dehydrogenase/5,10-methenyltetrahydrofolate cyclohydrolase [Zavarzinella sp.]
TAGVAALVAAGGRRPGLAAVLVGDNPASEIYVRNKRKACEDAGIASWLHRLPGTAAQQDLLDLIGQLNREASVSGILVQLPLPKQMNEAAIIRAVDPLKDVDCFHPENVGLLAAGHPRFLPCTPFGVQQMLARTGIPTAGRRAVIIGRSNIVGKPMALILMQKPSKDFPEAGDATVTVVHRGTTDLPAITRQADILIAAVGVPRFVTADMVQPGAAVIDVGINSVDGKTVGDVDADSVAPVAGWLSPVPRGVGPMTITMLLHNTRKAAMMG